MHALPGDQIVVDGTRPGTTRRDGEVVGLHHPDGTPPFDVRWSDTGRTTLYFPGPDAHVVHFDHAITSGGGSHVRKR
ncbi:hypothetical protein ABH931_007088 [Streptacidiphilus sp. MAP12-33]|uniref:DUF1918 domain-containing protein n=1 Tax=Streptacidiphilus sp. MAP12-33 TaxID=3156266 RepID=UPI0035180B46